MLTLHRVLAALSFSILFIGTAPCAGATRHRPLRIARRVLSPDELYSRRALQRARTIIELRLMELHRERLECVREAILRNLPADLRPRSAEGARSLGRETCTRLL